MFYNNYKTDFINNFKLYLHVRAMEPEGEIQPPKVPADLPKVHTKCNQNRPHTRFIVVSNYLFLAKS